MSAKTWTTSDIRKLAKRTVDGRTAIATSRGEYFRALIETTQADLKNGGPDQTAAVQLAALKAVHRRFYPVVQEATTTKDIEHAERLSKAESRRRSLERNRRTNFARSAYGTIRRWLRAPGHDLLKLNAQGVTKSQLLTEAPPTRKHALTPERVQAKADRLIGGIVGFAEQVAKSDRAQAANLVHEIVQRLYQKVLGLQPTKNASVATNEGRPLIVGRKVFLPANDGITVSRSKAA